MGVAFEWINRPFGGSPEQTQVRRIRSHGNQAATPANAAGCSARQHSEMLFI
jgi:hypothetical protein